MFVRSFTAAALAGLLALAPLGAQANQEPDKQEERDGQSRHESGQLNHLPLVFGNDRFMRVVQVVMILQEVTYLTTTAFGVDFKSDDRVGLGGLPVLGGLFEKSYEADDFTEENRVGSVFRSGDDKLAVVLTGPTALDGYRVVVFNGKGHYEIGGRPKLTEVSPASLLQLGSIPSMAQLIRGQAAKETVQLLAGLTAGTAPPPDPKVQALADVPLLQKLLLGTAHEDDDNNLMILLRTSIVMGDES
jgi:hypothetical protein